MNEIKNKLNTVLAKQQTVSKTHHLHNTNSHINNISNNPIDNTNPSEENHIIKSISKPINNSKMTDDKDVNLNTKSSTFGQSETKSISENTKINKKLSDTLKIYNQNAELIFQNKMLKHELEKIQTNGLNKLKSTSKNNKLTKSQSSESYLHDSNNQKHQFDETKNTNTKDVKEHNLLDQLSEF